MGRIATIDKSSTMRDEVDVPGTGLVIEGDVSVAASPTPDKYTTWVFGSADTEIALGASVTLTAPVVDIYTMETASLILLVNITTSADVDFTAELVTDGSAALNYGVTTLLANKAAGLHVADFSSVPYGHSVIIKAINNDATVGTIKAAVISRERLS